MVGPSGTVSASDSHLVTNPTNVQQQYLTKPIRKWYIPNLMTLSMPRSDVGPAELRRFVADLAARPELWVEHVVHDPQQRRYVELLRDEHVAAWLICWMEDQDTGYHDHDVSAGAVSVVSGRVREERLTIGGPARRRLYRAGETFAFSAADIHRVSHAGAEPAVTLHAYSPPLLRMGAYVLQDSGVLVRHPIAHTEELRAPAPARGAAWAYLTDPDHVAKAGAGILDRMPDDIRRSRGHHDGHEDHPLLTSK